VQLNEAELAVDSEKASYKQKLEVLQQQEELIEDEAEQEQVRGLDVPSLWDFPNDHTLFNVAERGRSTSRQERAGGAPQT
jgi:hypothetical protein